MAGGDIVSVCGLLPAALASSDWQAEWLRRHLGEGPIRIDCVGIVGWCATVEPSHVDRVQGWLLWADPGTVATFTDADGRVVVLGRRPACVDNRGEPKPGCDIDGWHWQTQFEHRWDVTPQDW